jgi:hypothetical protein
MLVKLCHDYYLSTIRKQLPESSGRYSDFSSADAFLQKMTYKKQEKIEKKKENSNEYIFSKRLGKRERERERESERNVDEQIE